MSEPSSLTKAIQAIAGLPLSRVMIVAAILTAAYYFMLYDDGAAIITRIEGAKIQLETENKKKIETQKVLKKEQQMKADVELFANKFEEIKARIPVEFSEAELRAIVNQYSTRNSLKTTRTERRPLATTPTAAAAAAASGENLVEQVVLGYEFEGSYVNIAKFVSEISSLEKIIKVGDFNLNLIPAAPNSVKARTYELAFKATIIGYKQSLEALKAVAPKKAVQ